MKACSVLRTVSFLLCSLLTFSAASQDRYPVRPVKFVVPFPAGGPLDVLARVLAQELGEAWEKPVVVENIIGGTGSIGANAVARAAPDGYTLLVTVDSPLTTYPAAAKHLPYNPRTDFKPVAALAGQVSALFVNGALNVSTVPELVALAKAEPGKVTFSSAGVASPSHFAGELFKAMTGVELTHIPYRGAAPAMAAVVSGQVTLMFSPIGQGVPHVQSGKLRALGITGRSGAPLLPGVRPLAEQGLPELVYFNWYAVMAPARTPDGIVAAITAGLKRVFDDPTFRARLETAGVTPLWQGPAEVARLIDADLKRWSELAQRARIESPH